MGKQRVQIPHLQYVLHRMNNHHLRIPPHYLQFQSQCFQYQYHHTEAFNGMFVQVTPVELVSYFFAKNICLCGCNAFLGISYIHFVWRNKSQKNSLTCIGSLNHSNGNRAVVKTAGKYVSVIGTWTRGNSHFHQQVRTALNRRFS